MKRVAFDSPTHAARLSLLLLLCFGAAFLPMRFATAAAPAAEAGAPAMKWLDLSSSQLELRGLPWFQENKPDLWRLPKSAEAKVPKGAWNRAVCPDGGRIRLSCNSSTLAIRVQTAGERALRCNFDAFVNGEYAGTVEASGTQPVDLVFFKSKDRSWKDITIYLPHKQQARFFAVGLDADAALRKPPAFSQPLPMVCYGSSVLQGTGATHPAHSYPAAVARTLNLDFVNLGFGGSGKGEPEVVALVNQLDACCYLFDLGKSYGVPTPERFNNMLDAIRASHPKAPIFCVTPIYSTKEENAAYKNKSEVLRTLMRKAAVDRRQAGDKRMYVVEGLYLFGEPDKALFHDSLHPNDDGNDLMARRLAPLIQKSIDGVRP